MTTRYDAWSELPAPLAEALRASLYSGDWSAWEPEVVDAFRRAFNDNDWSAFDPQTAITIRAAVGQEQLAYEAKANQERLEANANADRAMAAEMRELGAKYTDFHANAAEILQYGIKSNLTNLDHAYKAWRSSKGHDGPALAGQPSESAHPIADLETRLHDMDTRLEKLKLGDLRANSEEIRQVTWKRDDLRDELGLALVKSGNDPDRHRQNLIHEENEARVRSNAERTSRISKGYVDKSSKESRAARNARVEREAGDLLSGRTQPPTPKRQSSADRAADAAGLDDMDRKALAIVHGEFDSDSTTESALQDIASESDN